MPLACLTVALFAPAPSRAGCHSATHLDRTPVDGPVSTPTAHKTHTRLPGQPCSCIGPHCSRQPLAPPALTSVESVKISERGRLLPRLLLSPPPSDEWA